MQIWIISLPKFGSPPTSADPCANAMFTNGTVVHGRTIHSTG